MAVDLSIGSVIDSSLKANKGNELMAAVAASQAILESGLNGRVSGLAIDNHNLFGMKGSGTAGSSVWATRENSNDHINASFAKYNNIEESFQAHKNLLEKARYQPVLQAQNFEEAAHALKDCGYATDPKYAESLINVYNKYVKPVMGEVQGVATQLTRTPEASFPNVIRDLRAVDPNSKAAGNMEQLLKDGKLSEAQQASHEESIRILKANGVQTNVINVVLSSRFGGNSASEILKPENKSKTLAEIAGTKEGGLTKESLQGLVDEAKKAGVNVPDGKTLENTTAGELQSYALQMSAKTVSHRIPSLARNARGNTPEEQEANAEKDISDNLQRMTMNADGSFIGLVIAVLCMMFGGQQGMNGSPAQSAAPTQQADHPMQNMLNTAEFNLPPSTITGGHDVTPAATLIAGTQRSPAPPLQRMPT